MDKSTYYAVTEKEQNLNPRLKAIYFSAEGQLEVSIK
jgi:hypothetical protein